MFHRRLHWKLEPVLNKYHTNAFIARYLSGREAIPITLHIPVCFVICGRSVILDPLVVPVTIKGIGFRLIQEVHSYFPLRFLAYSPPGRWFYVWHDMTENPISADIQIRFIDFVAFESSLIFRAKHKFENFVLTVREINFYWFSSWDSFDHGRVRSNPGAPKSGARSQKEETHTPHRVKWMIYFYRPISRTYFQWFIHIFLTSQYWIMHSIRTPGTNRGLDIQNLSFRLRDVPFKAAFTLWIMNYKKWSHELIFVSAFLHVLRMSWAASESNDCASIEWASQML